MIPYCSLTFLLPWCISALSCLSPFPSLLLPIFTLQDAHAVAARSLSWYSNLGGGQQEATALESDRFGSTRVGGSVHHSQGIMISQPIGTPNTLVKCNPPQTFICKTNFWGKVIEFSFTFWLISTSKLFWKDRCRLFQHSPHLADTLLCLDVDA